MHGCELINDVLERLMAIAKMPVDTCGLGGIEPAKWDLPQVHVQNIMRAIFTEFKLAESSFTFIEPAFAVAIRGFSSNMYNVSSNVI